MTHKLLLVDDEDGIRTVLSVFLSDLGYDVLTAADGDAGLEVYRRERPPVVIADIKMAGMNGIELLRAIKEINAGTEVIMISGHGDMDMAIESLKLDAADFITKPINSDALEIAIKRAEEKIAMREAIRSHTENLEQMVRETSARLVEAERQLAVGQVVEGLFTAISEFSIDADNGLALLNDLPCYVSAHSKDLKIVAANRFFTERLGDRIGDDSWAIYADAAVTRDRCPVAETFDMKTTRRSIENIRVGDEEQTVSVYTAPIRNSDGDIELVMEIASDIAGIKQLQEDLRSTRQRYEELFHAVPCYITIQDRSMRLVEVNRRFTDDFGEALGRHCFQVYRGRKEPCADCPVQKTFEDGQSHQAEMVVTAKSGEEVNVLVWTAPIRDRDGRVVQVMEMATNITQVHRLQEHLASLGLMIGSVSHSIKGMLTGLDGGMYILDSGIESMDRQEIREGRDIIGLMADSIKRMVHDILYYAKESELETESVDVESFARDQVKILKARTLGRPIAVEARIADGLGALEADPDALRSALMNILDNAVDACMSDTADREHRVTLDVSRSGDRSGDRVVFEVADNAMGMDRRTLDRLFTLFFSTKGKKGTGLGLFITRKIIRQHGGDIQVDSEPGRGTRVTLAIPVSGPR